MPLIRQLLPLKRDICRRRASKDGSVVIFLLQGIAACAAVKYSNGSKNDLVNVVSRKHRNLPSGKLTVCELENGQSK